MLNELLFLDQEFSSRFFKELNRVARKEVDRTCDARLAESVSAARRFFGVGGRSIEEAFAASRGVMERLEADLWNKFGKPDFEKPETLGALLQYVRTAAGARGHFLKAEKARAFLSYLKADGDDTVQTYASLRFTKPREELNAALRDFYQTITPADFEERSIEVVALRPDLARQAGEFVQHKYHNLTHLKELGVIVIIPVKLEQRPGYFLRNLGLLIHYFREVHFYSQLFASRFGDQDFAQKFYFGLSGVVAQPTFQPNDILVIQRYLAKDDPNDFRLMMPRVNTEAYEYYETEAVLRGLTGTDWQSFSFAGETLGAGPADALFSYNFLDLSMNLFSGNVTTYHQRESLWNEVCMEAFGADGMRTLMLNGFFDGKFRIGP